MKEKQEITAGQGKRCRKQYGYARKEIFIQPGEEGSGYVNGTV